MKEPVLSQLFHEYKIVDILIFKMRVKQAECLFL